MLYLIRFDIQQPGASLSELRKIWSRGSGIIRSFKAMGQRSVFAVADFPDDETLDEALASLPIVEEFGSDVKIEVIPAWPYKEPGASGVVSPEPVEERTALAHEPDDQDASTTADPETAPGLRVFLQTVGDPSDSEALEVDQAGISLGRGSDNRVVIDDPAASYRHALIQRKGDGYRIEDLGSRDGTWVNDERVTDPYALEDGDTIRVGDTYMVFGVVSDEATRQDTPPSRPEIALTGALRSINVPEEEQAEPEEAEPERTESEEAELEEERSEPDREPEQPEEAQVAEASPSLDVREQTPLEENGEFEELADEVPLEPDREQPSAHVARDDEEPAPDLTSADPDAHPEDEATPEDASPSRGERYTRQSLLGSGEIAEVYLARDEELDRDVALKVLKKHYADDPQVVERFEREASNVAALRHPNVVAVHDWGRDEAGSYYMVMEYAPGGTLEERIQREGKLPATAAAGLGLRVARALLHAHEQGMIHRDVKPRNVLLTEEEAKVTDFGIARAAAVSTMTQEGAVLGTPQYVSPEQALGQPATPRSDLYSLGVMMYEMLTGELPHDAKTPVEIIMKHVSGHLRPPKEIDPEIPERLDAVVVRLLARNPNERYQSADELIKDLEQVVGGATGGLDAPQPEPPGGGQEEPARPEEGSLTGAIHGLDTPMGSQQASELEPAEARAAAGTSRSEEADQGPTQIEGEESITGTIRSLDAAEGAEQPAEGQITGMIRSLDAPKVSPATRVFLRIVDGPAAGETFEVGRAGATMGRSPENQIQKNDEKLSRRHAGIEFRDGSFWLSDLRSSNGTFVNQNRLNAPHRLRSGDVIKLGGMRLSVTLETAG